MTTESSGGNVVKVDTTPTKILIVDDRPENILALKNLIDGESISVVSARSGEEALSLILSHEFALALLDVQMPEMSGIELARLMRGTRRSRSIPIIFVTATASSREIIFEGYDEGAVDFLVKPLDPHIVRSKVRVFVELDQQRKLMSRQMEQLNRLKSKAEEISKTKSQFLANMSHEIRTPLGAILGFAEMLSESVEKDTDDFEFVDAIMRNGELLRQLIDDILDISKIEAGRLVVEKRSCDFRLLMDEIKQTFVPAARARNLNLLFRFSTEMPTTIVTDPVRLKQILINIIGNSLKFTTQGHVVVDSSLVYEQSEDGEKHPMLAIMVQDTGCGISDETVGTIFQPFVQADTSTSRLYGGTGLGLSISRHLTRSLGGDLELVSSIVGQGAVFRFTIDPGRMTFADAGGAAQKSKTRSFSSIMKENPDLHLPKSKLLVVDDMPDNLLLMRRMLGLAGADITCAESGERCVSLLKQKNFDAVLMDIQMPGLDGHETTRIIRGMGVHVPVIAVTAHTGEEYRAQSFRAGCDDHLTKPVDYGNLIKTIGFHIASKEAVHPTGETSKDSACSSKPGKSGNKAVFC